MKKLGLIILLCALLAGVSAMAEPAPETALYTGTLRVGAPVMAGTDGGGDIGYIPKGKAVEVLEVLPYWLRVRYKGTLTGYIKRSSMSDTSVKTLDPAITPPYSTVPCEWLAWVKGEAAVRSMPQEDAEALITLREGARIALVDITDGWGRIIFHRQYGYIDTRLLSEIQPINQGGLPGDDAPIAAYTSFYRITTDQSNLNRIVNIQVANDRFALYTLAPGGKLDFNANIGPYSRRNGYLPANVLVKGEVVQGYGGGTCQVSSTLYNVTLQLPGIEIIRRRAHGPAAASYLPHGADAAVGSDTQNFIIQNQYPYPVRIDGTAQDGALTIAIYRAESAAARLPADEGGSPEPESP